MRVFVAGGTGLIGSRLVRSLCQRQDTVLVLTRRAGAARPALGSLCTLVEGDPTRPGPWVGAVDDCDAVVNLTGEDLFKERWGPAFKKVLHDSRVDSTANLVQALARKPRTDAGHPRVLVNASAVGYYGACGDEELTEESPAGADFLARLCVEWERAALAAEAQRVRVVVVRTGVVLAPEGGALQRLLAPFRMGMGGPTGSGHQWVSWVHPADLIGILRLALDDASARGPLNATAPNPVTNRAFAEALGKALHCPAGLAAPEFAVRMMLGEVADVVLTGQRVVPKKASALGYAFHFPTLDAALADLLR
jgi:uncharacterized protein (TIGR01777 family)